MESQTRRVVGRPDDALSATVVRSHALRYRAGADPSLDRPAHVRAASGLVWVGARLAVVQDDANFIALVDPVDDGGAVAVPLPAGPGGRRQFDDGRGNKADKLDLEAVVSVPQADGAPLVVALGSGSSPRRERVVVCRGLAGGAPELRVELRDARAFYAGLRAAIHFAGSELNLEGAVYHRGRLRLFGRGNGAPRGDVLPLNATCDVDWRALMAHLDSPEHDPPPAPRDIVQYDLGAVGGVALGFTDAAPGPAPPDSRTEATARWTLYTAAAEASPDATRDGAVAGSAIGVIEESTVGTTVRWALLRDATGQPFAGKAEGIVLAPGDQTRAYVVVDRDAYDQPSELCEVVLGGAWFRGR